MNKDIEKLISALYNYEWDKNISEEDVKRILSQDNMFYFFHKEDDKLVGMVAMHIYEVFSRKVALIEEVVVLKEYRKRGIGEKLVKEAIDVAKEKGVTCVELFVKIANDSARQLYTKMGFYSRDNVAMRLWINKQ